MTHSILDASTSNSQHCGRMHELKLDKVQATQLVHGTIPMATSSWNEVPLECKEYIRVCISDDINLDYNREEDLWMVNMIMAKSYRQFKGRLHEHYKKKGGGNKEVVVQHPHPDMDEDTKKCKVNTENRKGLKVFHTADTRMFARYQKVLETSPSVTLEIGLAELYAASHKRKMGTGCLMLLKQSCEYTYIDPFGIVPTMAVMLPDLLQLSLEKMRELQEQAISDGRSYTDIDILHQVLGPKPGYVRGLGRAVKPLRSSAPHSSKGFSLVCASLCMLKPEVNSSHDSKDDMEAPLLAYS
ncbi:hypothetical protein CJ030_MR1G015687 [Morella rubra]|uniref:Uncharacterized protein n=1 Tax=Morella rubra TaxID=262757 RepID=A0A6A1WKT4_9ROSI|nr:hypothetical protein CJ030_MR1G015687 [Morella rubra]